MKTETTRLHVAKALTRWLNGKRQDPLPDWDALPLAMQTAYLDQANDALAALPSPELHEIILAAIAAEVREPRRQINAAAVAVMQALKELGRE